MISANGCPLSADLRFLPTMNMPASLPIFDAPETTALGKIFITQ